MEKFRIVLMQKKPGVPFTHIEAIQVKKFGPHFICYPEYFFINRKMKMHTQTPHNFFRELKRIEIISGCLNTVVIGGTMPEPENSNLFNTSFIYDKGKFLGSYRKQNLFGREPERITTGKEYKVFSAYGIKFGVLICADVLNEQMFAEMRKLKPKIIFIPASSPKRIETIEEKYKRDNEIFVKGAAIANAVIIKVCAVKSEFSESLQARSLIADKKGIIFRVNPDEEEKEMIIMKEINI